MRLSNDDLNYLYDTRRFLISYLFKVEENSEVNSLLEGIDYLLEKHDPSFEVPDFE